MEIIWMEILSFLVLIICWKITKRSQLYSCKIVVTIFYATLKYRYIYICYTFVISCIWYLQCVEKKWCIFALLFRGVVIEIWTKLIHEISFLNVVSTFNIWLRAKIKIHYTRIFAHEKKIISTKNGSSLKNEKLIFCFENLAPHPKLMLLEMCMCAYILYKVWFDWYSKTNVEYLCDCTLGKKGSSKLTKKVWKSSDWRPPF